MTGTTLPPDAIASLRAALRSGAGRWIARFYRHELLVARTVRGMQEEAVREFNKEIVNPLLRQVAGRLATFDLRGPDVVLELFPQLRALQAEIENTVARGSDAVRRLTTERLFELTRAESDWVRESAQKVLKVDAPTVNDAAIRDKVRTRPFLGAPVEKWFDKMLTVPTGDNARAWIQTGLQQGLTTDQIVRGLRGTKATGYTDGILTGRGAADVANLVVSAASHASAVARFDSFVAIGVSEWRWLATLDTKICPICLRNEAGSPYPMGEGPTFPAHPRCRCSPVPWFGTPIGNRASTDGPVPADQDAVQWLEGRSIAEQNEVLGKRKAELWRAGKLTIAKMFGPDLEPLSLAELRRLDRIPDDE